MSLAIFDGNYLLHRSLHVPSVANLQTTTGKPTGGVLSVLQTMKYVLNSFKDIDKCIMVYDAGRSQRRIELYPEYKGDRPTSEHDEPGEDGFTYKQKFKMNMNYLNLSLKYLGIPILQLPGREGDDVIYQALQLCGKPLNYVVSEDKGMFQLIRKNIRVFKPMKSELVHHENFEELVECPIQLYPLSRAIEGTSDNIDGIKGVGRKTFLKLVQKHFSDDSAVTLDSLIEKLASDKSKAAKKIVEGKDIIIRNLQLTDLSKEVFTEAEIDIIVSTCLTKQQKDFSALQVFFKALEFQQIMTDFVSWQALFERLT